MVEFAPKLTKFDLLIQELNNLLPIAEKCEQTPQVTHLIEISKSIAESFDTLEVLYFDAPIQYIQTFLQAYRKEEQSNYDVANILFRETMDIVGSYLDSLGKMSSIYLIQAERQREKEKSNKKAISDISEPLAQKTELQEAKKVGSPSVQYDQVNQQNISSDGQACTLISNGLLNIEQITYECQTCFTGQRTVCQQCASTCHAGHSLRSKGKANAHCYCRFMTTICKHQEACTLKHTGQNPIIHQKFACVTCKMEANKGQMICQHCKDQCHKGHTVIYTGVTEGGYCDCSSLYSFCQLKKF